MAQTMATSTNMTRKHTTTCSGEMPPMTVVTMIQGRAATRNPSASSQAASSLPPAIWTAVSRVACRIASVPASRSPLIDRAVNVGVTSSDSPRTKSVMVPNAAGPNDADETPWLRERSNAASISRVTAPMTTNQIASAT